MDRWIDVHLCVYIYISMYVITCPCLCARCLCARYAHVSLSSKNSVHIHGFAPSFLSFSFHLLTHLYVKPALCVRSVVHMQCGTVWRL